MINAKRRESSSQPRARETKRERERERDRKRERGSGRETQKEIVMKDGCLWSVIALHSLNLDHSESPFPFAFEQPICTGLLTIRWLWRIHPLHEIFVVINGGWLGTAHRGEHRLYRGRIVASIGKFVFVFFSSLEFRDLLAGIGPFVRAIGWKFRIHGRQASS